MEVAIFIGLALIVYATSLIAYVKGQPKLQSIKNAVYIIIIVVTVILLLASGIVSNLK